MKEKLENFFKNKKKDSKAKLRLQFITFLSYFDAYLSVDGNVYQAIKSCYEKLDGEIKSLVGNLINEMDEDKGIDPFINFANVFDEENISQIVTMIYQYGQVGNGKDKISEMLPLLERLKNIAINEYVEKEKGTLNLILAMPLLGVTVVSLAFSLGILNSIVVNI